MGQAFGESKGDPSASILTHTHMGVGMLGCGSNKWRPKMAPKGNWNRRLKPAVGTSSSILSHTHMGFLTKTTLPPSAPGSSIFRSPWQKPFPFVPCSRLLPCLPCAVFFLPSPGCKHLLASLPSPLLLLLLPKLLLLLFVHVVFAFAAVSWGLGGRAAQIDSPAPQPPSPQVPKLPSPALDVRRGDLADINNKNFKPMPALFTDDDVHEQIEISKELFLVAPRKTATARWSLYGMALW